MTGGQVQVMLVSKTADELNGGAEIELKSDVLPYVYLKGDDATLLPYINKKRWFTVL